VAALLLVAGASLYLGVLDRFGFWLDEVQSALSTRLGFAAMVEERLANGHPPLFFGLLWLLARAAGESEAVLRLPAAVASLGSAVLVFAIVTRPRAPRPGERSAPAPRIAHPWVAILAMALLLVNPLQVGLAVVARPYTTVQALALLAVALLVRDEGRDAPRSAVLFSGVCALALYTHFSAAWWVASLSGLLAWRRAWRHLAGAGVAALLLVPWILGFASLTSVDERIGWIADMAGREAWRFFALPFYAMGHASPGDPRVLPASALALALGLVGARRLGEPGIPLAALWLGPPLLAFVAALLGLAETFRVARYFTASAAAELVLLAGALAGPARAWKGKLLPGVALAALVALSLANLAAFVRHGSYPAHREAARTIEARRRSGEIVVAQLPPERWHWRPYLYYQPGPVYALGEPGRPPRSREEPTPPPDAHLESGRIALPDDATGAWIYYLRPASLTGTEAATHEQLRVAFPEHEALRLRRGLLVHRWRSAE
jgi:hypothetical protein